MTICHDSFYNMLPFQHWCFHVVPWINNIQAFLALMSDMISKLSQLDCIGFLVLIYKYSNEYVISSQLYSFEMDLMFGHYHHWDLWHCNIKSFQRSFLFVWISKFYYILNWFLALYHFLALFITCIWFVFLNLNL
jgi:hypothetical protein